MTSPRKRLPYELPSTFPARESTTRELRFVGSTEGGCHPPNKKRPWQIRRAAIATVAGMLTTVLTGCTGSSSSMAPTVSAGTVAGGAADLDDGPPLPNAAMEDGALRDARYCEVIPTVRNGDTITSSVYNSFGHSPCTDAEWDALTEQIVNQQFGSQSAQLNGPRLWVFDNVAQPGDQATDPRTYQFAGIAGRTFTFGDIETVLRVELPTTADQPVDREQPYTVHEFPRNAVWTYQAGSSVHELTDPDGTNYVMESYSQEIDPTLSWEQLDALGGQLTLPQGWSYSSRPLTEDLVLGNGGTAYLVHDNLDNSYQMNTTGSPS